MRCCYSDTFVRPLPEGHRFPMAMAVAVRGLQHIRTRRIAIVDCDVHQGNGTPAIFAGDPAVFTFSMHEAR